MRELIQLVRRGRNLLVCMCAKLLQSCLTLRCYGLQHARLLCPRDSPGKNTGVGCHFLLQGIFLIQESNPCLQHCRQILYRLSVLQSGAFHWGAFPTREKLKPSKGSGACGTESPPLTVGVCSKVRIYCRAPNKRIGDKPQIYSNLVFD